jgi:flagellar hook-basal body complex protein FliE
MEMTTLEQVEKLREKANVSYDEAKTALDATNGDILDAMIYLERQGKVGAPSHGGYYSSEKTGNQDENSDKQKTSEHQKESTAGETFGEMMKKFIVFCARLIQKGCNNTFDVIKGEENKASIPVIMLIVLIVFAFWITIPLIIIGLFFGLRYRFSGPDIGKNVVNNVMDDAANAAVNLKKSVKENK